MKKRDRLGWFFEDISAWIWCHMPPSEWDEKTKHLSLRWEILNFTARFFYGLANHLKPGADREGEAR